MKTHAILMLGALLSLGSVSARAEIFETSAGLIEVARKIEGLDTPWALGFLPDGCVLVTERGGRLLLVRGGQAQAITGGLTRLEPGLQRRNVGLVLTHRSTPHHS